MVAPPLDLDLRDRPGRLPSPGSVRALSLWRPWADWVIFGWKTIETRLHQRFRCLGDRPTLLAIHAAAKWDKTAIDAARQWLTEDQIRLTETIIRQHPVEGHVIGTVMVGAFGPLDERHEPYALIECRSVQRYGLSLKHPTPLVPPMKVRGMQGLFRVQIPAHNTNALAAPTENDHGN